jgi:P22_AR N-terminal domain
MTATAMMPVPFHERTLYLVEQDNQPFVVMKPIVEGMGLAWGAQAAKLRGNRVRWGVSMIDTPSSGGRQRTVCLPLRKLPGWLYSIDHNRVRNELRSKIVAYQNHCDDVLWDYWMKRHPQSPLAAPTKMLTMEEWANLEHERAELLAFKCATLEARTKRRHVRPARPVTQEDVQTILDLARQGVSRLEIARRVDRSPALISYTIRAHVGEGSPV